MTFQALIEELGDPAQRVSASKLVGLSGLDTGEVSQFLEVWSALDSTRRRRITHDLVDLAEDSVDLNFDAVFAIGLADEDTDVRLTSIRGLWEHEGRDLIDPLLALLSGDSEAAVRAEAALALGRYVLQAEFDALPAGDAERIEQALARTATDVAEISEVRSRALEALGGRTMPWVRDLIEEAFVDGDRRLRIGAIHAMGRSCEVDWLPSLIAELANDDPEVRYEAATALGEIADEDATQHLLQLLSDDDAEVQEAAIAALGEIGGEEARGALEELQQASDERIREAVTAALAEVEFAADPLAFKFRG